MSHGSINDGSPRLRRHPGHLGAVALASAAVLLGAVGCGGANATEAFPSQPIRVIVGGAPGGGLDTAARQLEPALSDALGEGVRVENHEGGNWAIATNEFLAGGAECYAITLAAFPHIFGSYLTQDVDYTYDDFAAIGANTIQPGVIRVRDDAPWQTLTDLVEDARANPGEIRVSVSGSTSNNFVGMTEIEQATGVDFNIVPYEGEGPESRTALLSGEVDVVHAGVFNTLDIATGTRVLAVQQDENRWAELTNDAPTVNEELGTDVAPNQSTYGLFASAECARDYPDRYQALIDAYGNAVEDPQYLEILESLDQTSKLYLLDAEEYDAQLRDELAALMEAID